MVDKGDGRRRRGKQREATYAAVVISQLRSTTTKEIARVAIDDEVLSCS